MKPALGVCYYPEQWSPTHWQRDAEHMVATGIRWVRIAEFAWSRLEPAPNQLEWAWLDQVIDCLGNVGLRIVLGTPTATPPRWMLDKYPDLLPVAQDGQPRQFGSRRHYDFSHLAYRQEAVRICELLADRYATHPALGGWQIDNEYGCHATTRSYSAHALCGFQHWLAERYGTISALNQAWGNVFWSMEYSAFHQIALPNQTVTEANPIHWLDFYRYASAQVVDFNRLQVAAIRRYDATTPLLHNYMGLITDFDHFATGQDLEVASWDSYPLGFLEDRVHADSTWKQRFMRQGDPDFQALHHDLYRAVGRGRWWVMEQQPGPVNWAPYNPAPLAGMVRLWTWEALAHGAEVVAYFRWRQAPFAQEQMHSGLLRPDDQAAPALTEVQQVAAELAELDLETTTAPVAIVFDYESAWAWETQPQGRDFSYFQVLFEQYRALRRLGLSIDICPPSQRDFSAYRVVLVPALMAWSEGLKAALQTCNGSVLIGPRTGSKTADFQIPAHLPPDCAELLALKVSQVESLRPDVALPLSSKGAARAWLEHLELTAQTQVILQTETGLAILVQQGRYYYLAAQLDELGYQTVMETICTAADLTTTALPEGLRLRQCGERVFAFNYNPTTVSLNVLASQYQFPVTELAAAGVAEGSTKNARISAPQQGNRSH